MTPALRAADRPVLIAFGFVVLLILLGGLYNPRFLSAFYLLQQLQVAAFLGIIASGLMVVILLGHIDLSIPWAVTIGGMAATAAAGWWGEQFGWLGPLVAIASGSVIGLANGLGVAFLRIPSMVFTLGMNAVVQGIVVMYTGGNAPVDRATPILQWLAVHETFHVPHAAIVWAIIGLLVVLTLGRTPFGRYVYAIGNSERVTYLSGVNTRIHPDRRLHRERRLLGIRRRASRRLCRQGLPGHGRSLPPAGNCGGGPRRYQHPRRKRQLSGHGRRRDPDHRARQYSLGRADIGSCAADHLRRDHHRDDADLWPCPPDGRLGGRMAIFVGTVRLAGVLGRLEQRWCPFEHPRDPRSIGLFRRLVREALPKIAVENSGPNLKQKMGASLCPLHLLLFDHPSGDQGIHAGLSQRRRDAPA